MLKRTNGWRTMHALVHKFLRGVAAIGVGGMLLAAHPAHAEFVNGGFEGGTFGSEWIKTTLQNNGVPTVSTHTINPKSIKDLNLRANAGDAGYDPNLYTTTGTAPDATDLSVVLDAGGAGARSQQDHLLTGAIPAASLRWPFAGNNSALVNLNPLGSTQATRHIARSGSPTLGNPPVQYTSHASRASSIRQRAQVTAADVDADGKVHVRFAMTPVLDNPGLIKVLGGTVSAASGSAIVTGTGTNFTATVSPGNYVRLGTNNTDRQVLSVDSDTQITLTSNAINVTNGAVYVSSVSGGHFSEEQPYFAVEVRKITSAVDSTPVPVPGAPASSPGQLFFTFNFSNQPGTVWHDTTNNTRNYAYSEFITFDIAPGNAKLQVGDWIELELVAAGCSPGGHEGHVHVDSFSFRLPDVLWVSVSGPVSVSSANGTQITYTYTYTNKTSDPVSNATVTPVMPQDNSAVPQNVTYVSSSGGNCTPASGGATATPPTPGGSLSCNVGTLAPGQSGSFTVTVVVPDGAMGPINNGNYTIAGDAVDPLPGPMWKTDLVSPSTLSDMDVDAVTLNLPPTANVGTLYTGSYTCTNKGAAAADVATCDAANLPAGVGVSACTVSPANTPWTQPGTVPSGETVTCQVSGTPTTTGSVTVHVTTGADNDPNTLNNERTAIIAIAGVLPTPDMAIDLASIPPSGTVGVPYSGSFTCQNIGAATALTGTICAVGGLPAGVNQGACSISTGGAWTAGNAVPAGAFVTCAVSGTPTSSGGLTVNGSTGATGDINVGNNTASKPVSMTTAPDVLVDVSGLPATARVGVSYTGSYTCTNAGSADAVASTSCSVAGLPPGLSTSSCTVSPGASAWVAGNAIPQGQAVTCQVSGTPTTLGTATANGTTGAAGDGDTSNNTQSRVIAVEANAPASIPTLSEWGLVMLSSLMVMMGLIRRKRALVP
ncbi:IPTL-CTERM sorting domain-containing protein [Acidovorax sp. sif1233]|uniref:IPTL-CTERM sorting domain-containing protein n=1 Tax=Acidovorax sp. sif1233 TaxID=2854792 RepID=UPI001C47924A|nr:IPTL-CTERM sorting domain-containing protein [Acidovorax sp. sif1233]